MHKNKGITLIALIITIIILLILSGVSIAVLTQNGLIQNANKAKEVLGWTAKYGIDEMCEDTWRWQSSNPNGYSK